MTKNYSAISLFAGIGGICTGFKNAGVDIVYANDMDKNACITYRNNYDHLLQEAKIEDVNEKVESLNGLFHIVDFTTDKIVTLTDRVVDGLSGIASKLIFRKRNKDKRKEEENNE